MDNIVSIIIPAYNAEAFVKEAVDSALAQTYPYREIIVVDDGSIDGTKHLLAPYIAQKRIVYLYQQNAGLAAARNAGIKHARGAFIAFLDADDFFAPEKVALQVAAFEAHPEFGVCYSDLTHFTDGPRGTFYHHRYHYPTGNIFEPLLHKQFVNPLSVMARREIFDQYGFFDETLRRSEDWDLWLRWTHAGVQFFYLDIPLAYSRIRNVDNLSSAASEPEMKEKNLFLFSRLGKQLMDEEWRRYHFDAILAALRRKAAFAHLLVGDKQAALRSAEGMPGTKFLISLLPAGAWKVILGFLLRVKHRLLLKKV